MKTVYACEYCDQTRADWDEAFNHEQRCKKVQALAWALQELGYGCGFAAVVEAVRVEDIMIAVEIGLEVEHGNLRARSRDEIRDQLNGAKSGESADNRTRRTTDDD